MNNQEIMAIERPHINLLKLYFIRSALTLPFFVIMFPPLLIRYLTLRYQFDEKSITMRWGFIFRKEVHITYSRIQDLHINCGLLQRWLGLADILIQTASGNASAEVQIEGLTQYDDVRNFLYSKMRGYDSEEEETEEKVSPDDETLNLLNGILAEMRGINVSMKKILGEEVTEPATDEELEPLDTVQASAPPPMPAADQQDTCETDTTVKED